MAYRAVPTVRQLPKEIHPSLSEARKEKLHSYPANDAFTQFGTTSVTN